MRYLNNWLYRVNNWLDRNELCKFLIMLSVVGFSNLVLVFGNSIYGVIPILILFVFTLVRMKFQTGDWDFKKDIYKIPEVGDVFVIKKNFWWDGSFLKNPPHGPGAKPNYWIIREGSEWRITQINDQDGDWKIYLSSILYDEDITINYFESRKFWKTKSDIRNEKLRILFKDFDFK